MNLFIFCMINQKGILTGVRSENTSRKHELYIHLETSVGLPLEQVLNLPASSQEGFLRFSQQFYWFSLTEDFSGGNNLLFLTDAPVLLHYFKTALDHTVEGIQLFDEKGDFLYLNKTCEDMENLTQEHVEGKHVLEVYEVDREYSTIMNTLKNQSAVQDRCGIFQNREGRRLYSLNTGIPVTMGEHFLGAIGLVYDSSTFSAIDHKRELIQKYLKDNNTPVMIHDHVAKSHDTFDDIIGESPSLQKALGLAKKVSVTDVSILLYGETGVGKEIFAQSIHSHSPRKNEEFVAINCAALPSSIIESLLFGTTKGAFTGSLEKKGLFETAEGGTIFLDEINSMDISLQSKLLRVIQEKSFRRLGGTQTIYCNTRFITAMNETPEQAIANHHLREDLYYRLGTILIEIPPLRERGEDILLLAKDYLTRLSKKYFRNLSGISSEAGEILLRYSWPGNVRELFQVLEYACNMAEGEQIEANHLPGRMVKANPVPIQEPVSRNTGKTADSLPESIDTSALTFQEKLEAYERQLLERELALHGLNITKTAAALGIQRQNLQYRLKKCGIKISPQITIGD